MLNYREALEFILQRTDFERDRGTPYAQRDWRLARVQELLEQLGNPHLAYRSVHIAGTKGKGSTTAMIEAMLRAAHYRTGMYTSPHLHTFRERIRLQGAPISEADLVALVNDMQPIVQGRPSVSVFEMITALGMWYMARSAVDVGVFEVGLGGRLDATNVLQPLVSVITSISIDHVNVLGSTLAQIAGEKAGIIKPGVPVVTSPQRAQAMRVLVETAALQKAPLTAVESAWRWRALGSDEQGQRVTIYRKGSSRRPEYPDLFLPLLGAFQLENACTAIATIEVLKEQGLPVPEDAVRSGLSSVQWPGRLQVLARNPLLVVDGAHNAYSLTQLIKSLPAYLDYQRLLLVFGAGRAHQPEGLLQVLLPAVDQAFLTQARHPKAESVANLVAIAQRQGTAAEGYPSSQEALQGALAAARPGDLILATGSLFLVAEIMSEWAALSGDEPYPSDPPGVY